MDNAKAPLVWQPFVFFMYKVRYLDEEREKALWVTTLMYTNVHELATKGL